MVLALIFPKNKYSRAVSLLRKNYGLKMAFIAALFATTGSLFYSEVIGYTPCKLCWFQRVFMYPQVILLFLALWKKEKNVGLYCIGLSMVGGLISIYHYLIQTKVTPAYFCSVAPGEVDCAQKVALQFGYITIPLMALTAFVMIILLVNKKPN
jgi:disulfide bond formation protein DsbB